MNIFLLPNTWSLKCEQGWLQELKQGSCPLKMMDLDKSTTIAILANKEVEEKMI
jgi:hypothetical protein